MTPTEPTEFSGCITAAGLKAGSYLVSHWFGELV